MVGSWWVFDRGILIFGRRWCSGGVGFRLCLEWPTDILPCFVEELSIVGSSEAVTAEEFVVCCGVAFSVRERNFVFGRLWNSAECTWDIAVKIGDLISLLCGREESLIESRVCVV